LIWTLFFCAKAMVTNYDSFLSETPLLVLQSSWLRWTEFRFRIWVKKKRGEFFSRCKRDGILTLNGLLFISLMERN
jgi:hypothetical protein